MRRLVLVTVCAFALPASVAHAWTWPVDGPVLRPFAFDHSSPYAGGQHRGVDLGAPAGTPVLAPAAGMVSFAGTVPSGGKTISIQTPFGYTATLLHLGSIGVTRGALVGEGSVVGAVGAGGDSPPFVYFGVRVTSDPQGYVDPLNLLPPQPVLPTAPSPPVESSAQPETPAEPVVEATPPVEAASVELSGAPAEPLPSSAPAGVAAPEADAGAVAPASHESATVAAPETQSAAKPVSLQAPSASRGAQGSTGRPHAGEAESSRSAPATTSSSPQGRARQEAGAGSPTIATSVAPGAADHLHIPLALGALMVTLGTALAVRRRSAKKAARIMSIPKLEPNVGAARTEEDPGRAGLAVRGREAAPRPRGRVRRAGGHLRALPPLEGQRRADGEWNGRARDAGDGDCGSRRRLAA